MNSSENRDLSCISFEGKTPPRPRLSRAARNMQGGSCLRGARPGRATGRLHRLGVGRAGLDAAAYRPQPLHRRLPACLRAMKVHSPHAARELLERKPRLVAKAVSSLLIGVTEFFREPGVFDFLRTQVLPALAGRNRRLRIWSAACSTGAELYSMAILLSEAGLLERSCLLGTDCRGDAIERAKLGLYDAAMLKLVPCRDAGQVFRAGRATVEAGRGPPPAGPLEGRGPAGRRGGWAVGHHFLAECRHLPQALSGGNDLAPVGVGLAPQGVLIAGKADRPPRDAGLTHAARCVYRVADGPDWPCRRQGNRLRGSIGKNGLEQFP